MTKWPFCVFISCTMRLSCIKKFQLLYIILTAIFCASISAAAEPEELRQRLELLQKSVQGKTPEEPLEELEKRLLLLKELLKKEGVSEGERKGLEEKLEMLIAN